MLLGDQRVLIYQNEYSNEILTRTDTDLDLHNICLFVDFHNIWSSKKFQVSVPPKTK